MSIEQLKNSLQAFKGHITRAINNCTSVISSDVDKFKLETSISFLESKWPGYDQAYMALEAAIISDGTGIALSSVQEDYYAVWENYQNNLVKFKSCLQNASGTRDTRVHAELTKSEKPKLPTLKLPTFAGDYTEFDSFFDQFQAQIGQREDLAPVTKLQYLKAQLKGGALDLIKDIPSISDNYKHAIDALREMYGDEDKIKRGILSKILDLDSPGHNKNDLETFKISLINLTRALKDKEDYSNCEWIIAYLFQRKLSKATIQQLYLKYGKNYFTIEEMKEGIGNIVSHMECEGQITKKRVNAVATGNKVSKSDIGTYSAQKSLDDQKVNGNKVKSVKNKHCCIYCTSNHYTSECDKYSTVSARQSRLQELKRCSKCISNQHSSENCKLVLVTCKKCGKGKHHTALCVTKVNRNSFVEEPTQHSHQTVMSVKSETITSTALPTATMEVCNERNKQKIYTRAFFDQGSQCTFIKENLVNKLQLNVVGTIKLAMSGFLHTKDYEEYKVVRPVVRLGNRKKRIKAVVLEKLPDKIRVPGLVNATRILEAGNIKLADTLTSDVIEGIEMVIGGDFYGDFITGLSSYANIKLNKSSGGHLIFGQITNNQSSSSTNNQSALVARLCTQEIPNQIEQLLEEKIPVHKLWDLDTIGICPNEPAPEDRLAYQSYIDTVEYRDNKYHVRLPWKVNTPSLPSNYSMALGQLKTLTSALQSRDEVKMYHDIIKSQLDNDFIEMVPRASPQDKCHYLPHHGVKKDSVTTPLRIVFNCSAKRGNNPSLNDCLMTGPSLTEKLGDVLLKFRINQHAYSADISKAFLRIGLQEPDRDFTRFLWYENPETLDQPCTYRFKSVLFGATSSPFLLQATIDHHLKKSGNTYKDLIAQNFYVDNFQGTVSDQEELFSIYENANSLLTDANLPLRMWVSNNPVLNQRIEEDFQDYKVPATTNLLGLHWDAYNDKIIIKPPAIEDLGSLSKRKLLSLVASVFDPLGLLSPITIRGKMLIREAWQQNLGWDDQLPPSFESEWIKLKTDLLKLDCLSFNRNIGQDEEKCTLHVFNDASSKAYGAVAYLTVNGESNILTSKARVTPMKTRSLPQLELTAIQIGTRLARYITTTLKSVDIENVYIWSDSEVALQWIRNGNSNIVYVKNRVSKISCDASGFKFHYVPSNSNPADLLSRGASFTTISESSLWKNGPSWLSFPDTWPNQKENVASINTLTETTDPTPIFNASEISSLSKIINITKYVFTFLKRVKPSLQLTSPMKYWLHRVQQEQFRNEYDYLSTQTNTNGKSCLVKSLGLYIDPDTDLIHCRGRLLHSELTTSTKFPILLPRRSWLTTLLIERAHKQTLHGGVADTLSLLREQYWLPKGRQVVKTILKKCLVCKVIEGRVLKQPGPPALPKERVIHKEPFQTVGVDYTGCITLKNPADNSLDKYYVCMFTCATTRAIHLELARDLSAQTFLNILRRFVARRSSPRLIISDNATNFKGTSNFLKDLFSQQCVQDHLNHHDIEWKFIPPRAPWMGGFYERLIGVVKNCIRKVLYKRKISEDELHTILTEVEMRINNRPLTYVDDDINNPQPLTPSHLIHGRRLQPMPSEIEDKGNDPDYLNEEKLRTRYSYIYNRIKHWEKVWRKEYLLSLREKFYGAQPPKQERTLKEGDIVIVETDGARDSWPLGKITALHPDKAGIIRVVEVMSRGTTALKTLDKLIPLEMSCDIYHSKEDDTVDPQNRRRDASVQAQQAIRVLCTRNLV